MALRLARHAPDTPMVGTADQVADEMAALIEEVGGDGFLIAGPLTPANVGRIVDGLVPALQERGLARSTYSGTTLRDHLGEF
jgi:alkanesulfonate monooxygenase SsuD/methylene tetrahydromethanopterin reductase-like flavin-dependent oxidoreductase (luciferase family)